MKTVTTVRAGVVACLFLAGGCGSKSSSGAETQTLRKSAACTEYAAQVSACFASDPQRLERMLARLDVVPDDEDAGLRQRETCARDAARLRRSCQ